MFQEVTEGVEATASISEEKTLSVIDLIVNGGTGSIVIIMVLFVLLFVAMYIYFERIFAIKAASIANVPDPHIGSTRGLLLSQSVSNIIPAAKASLIGAAV